MPLDDVHDRGRTYLILGVVLSNDSYNATQKQKCKDANVNPHDSIHSDY